MTGTSYPDLLGDVVDSARDLGSVLTRSAGVVAGRLGDDARGMLDRGRSGTSCGCGGSCCEQQACWLPKHLPDLTSRVAPGSTARVCISVCNCGLETRSVFVAATGPDSGLARGNPATTTIGALELGKLVAEVTMPKDSECAELILWVRGCHDTALRWRLHASDGDCSPATHHITVHDCPSTRHSWFDHFQQPKPCGHGHDD